MIFTLEGILTTTRRETESILSKGLPSTEGRYLWEYRSVCEARKGIIKARLWRRPRREVSKHMFLVVIYKILRHFKALKLMFCLKNLIHYVVIKTWAETNACLKPNDFECICDLRVGFWDNEKYQTFLCRGGTVIKRVLLKSDRCFFYSLFFVFCLI